MRQKISPFFVAQMALFFNDASPHLNKKANMRLRQYLCKTIVFIVNSVAATAIAKPLVIAHRGASGYAPEHTIASTALAHGMDPDFIELDIVLTKDNEAIVLHDTHLETVTNVKSIFPKKHRSDKRYYAIDFTLKDIRKLKVNERLDVETLSPVFPMRFPQTKVLQQKIPTLAEIIELVSSLNLSRQRKVGLYLEIKAPEFHSFEGRDISKVVFKILEDYKLSDKTGSVFIQSFDANELRRIKQIYNTKLPLVQLIEPKVDSPEPHHIKFETDADMQKIATYAVGIGPSIGTLLSETNDKNKLIHLAKKYNLLIHPWTVRNDYLPDGIKSIEELLTKLVKDMRVDGLFTDFPDTVRTYLKGM